MAEAVSSGAGLRAGRREWIGFTVLALPALMAAFDIGGLFLALPHLSADLGASSTQQLWISDIYGFTLAGFVVTMGTLGDRIGRRRLLLSGAAVFGVMSVVAAYSDSPTMLIVTRGLLGIAGATLMPSTLALVSNIFKDERQRARAIAGIYTCVMVGSALGPVVGGLLLRQFWWGSVFLLGVPFMVLLLIAGPVLVPEYRMPQAGRLDLPGVVLSLLAILPVVYGMKQLAAGDPDTVTQPIGAIVAGIVSGVLFVRRQRRAASPLLDVSLFASRSFSAVFTALLLAAACMAGTFLLTSQYVQTVLGYSPARSGLLLAPIGLSIAAGATLAPAVAERIGRRTAISGGLLVGAAGFSLVTQAHTSGGLVPVVVGLALVHFFVGPLLVLGAGLIIGAVPRERAGSAASLAETGNYLGSMLGMAALGTIGAAVYRGHMAGAVPGGIPDDAAHSVRDTAAGAVAVADRLPADQGGHLLTAAGNSFTAGLHIVGIIGAVTFLALALLTAITLRPKPDSAGRGGTSDSTRESMRDAAAVPATATVPSESTS